VSPKLSVVIASYNHEDYISETLKSLENQSFQDFEIIVVDDGSTDKTVERAKSCGSRADIYTQENRGVVCARNRGVSLAKGKYVCFVDSDDLVLRERFERQVGLLDTEGEVGMVFADALIIDAQGREIGRFSDVYPVVRGDVAEKLALHYCFTPMITVMVRMEVLRKAGPFEEPGAISDYMKWIEVAHLSKVLYDPTPLGCWRRHKSSTSKQANKEISYTKTRITLKRILRRHPGLRARIGAKMAKRYGRSYFLTGFHLAADGNVERASKYYRKAAKVYPASVTNWAAVVLTALPMKGLVAGLHRYVRSKKLPW
jgi:glycosyltransferase involved in cell wall biosynthesis